MNFFIKLFVWIRVLAVVLVIFLIKSLHTLYHNII